MSSPTTAKPKSRAPATSTDEILGGRICVVQPRKGHRAGSDAVFLAASVPARVGESVLDIGAGAGVAGLCLMARIAAVKVTAVEIDKRLAELAAGNAEKNGFGRDYQAIVADVTAPAKTLRQAGLAREGYHQLIANPPFYPESKVRAAPDSSRAAAHVMRQGGLAAWVRFFAAMAAPNGILTMIHRPDCLGELLGLFAGRFGDIAIFPLYPKEGEEATRVIVQAKKGSRAGISLLPGLILHEEDGRYRPAAESVLRGGAALELRSSVKRKSRPQ